MRWPIKRRLQHFFHLLPSFRSHYLSLILHPSSFIVLKSHALAARQSRRTVIKEIPSTSAVSQAETTKISQFYDSTLARIDLREPIEGFIEGYQFRGALIGHR